ncbi:MAG: alanine--tRNA ligase-related protein [bacterium]|nr:alanine--tRNA ligase-related protein [bacterium]
MERQPTISHIGKIHILHGMNIPSTKLLYLEDFTALSCVSRVVNAARENDRDVLILDQTVFYPQGGGQPYDRGVIVGASGRFRVEEVRFVDGVVRHIGALENGTLHAVAAVTCQVDEARRLRNSRLHSAGHVVDMAADALHLGWTPGKGYHFPDGPYVEYTGSLDALDKEKLKSDLEEQCGRFIAENLPTTVRFMDKTAMAHVCRFVPETIPEGKPGRVVFFGDFGVPCGGTHVRRLGEIETLTIRKIKAEGARVRIGYAVSPEPFASIPSAEKL